MKVHATGGIYCRMCVIVALFLGIAAMPAAGAFYTVNTSIHQGATVFIGEQGLNLTPAQNEFAAQVKFQPTIIGWWASAATIRTSAPSTIVQLTSPTNQSMIISYPAFGGYYGNWYVVEPSGFGNTTFGAFFTVKDPQLSIDVWDFSQNAAQGGLSVSGKSIGQGDSLGFKIGTNMDTAITQPTQRQGGVTGTDVNYWADIKVKTEQGSVLTLLLNESGMSNPITRLSINTPSWFWGQTTETQWSTGAFDPTGQDAYPQGTYTVTVESKMNGMLDNYLNGGAAYTGKTVSQAKTVTIVSEILTSSVNTGSVTRCKPFSLTITGRPNTVYHLWVKNTGKMSGGIDDQPPVIVPNQAGVALDPQLPVDGTYTPARYVSEFDGKNVLGYVFKNSGSDMISIWDDVTKGSTAANSTLVGNGTWLAANITTSDPGTRTVEFVTTNWTKTQNYIIRVERNASGRYRSAEVSIKVERGYPITWTVGPSGCNFTSIQAAVDNADNGDTILVKSGSYYEMVNLNKSLTLRGFDSGTGKPIVDARGGDIGIRITSSNCTIDGFVIRNARNYGIYVQANNGTIRNNTFSNNGNGVIADYWRSHSHLIENNIFESRDGGIRILYGDLITIRNNNFISGSISLESSHQNDISENTIENSQGTAIYLYDSNKNRISENQLRSSNRGIYISSDSSSTVVMNNTLEGNTVGVEIQGANTTFALNNFIENAQQGTISGSPIFLNSTTQIPYMYHNRTYTGFIGNYWSDYRDTDSNNDGIWDNPHPLDSGIDYTPLVGRWNGTAISQQVPPRILTVGSAGCNFTRIQDAISNASTGDIIQIMSGTYPEQIVLKKRLTLQGIDTGSGQPQITSSTSSGTAITLLTGLIRISNINLSGFDTGITVQSNGNTIENITILAYSKGFSLSFANDNKLLNNMIKSAGFYANSGTGISLLSSSRNTIANNTVQNWYSGISAYSSDNNAILSNYIASNQNGIYTEYKGNCRISHNTIEKNNYGIRIEYSTFDNGGHNITENTIANNAEYGISVSGYKPYHQISLNNFINNKNSFQDASTISTWNTLSPLHYFFKNTTFTNYLGNYWSDYTGKDANGDGIGDTPYTAVTDPDNYPLMGTWNGTGITQERPQPIIIPTPIPTITPIPPESWGILTLPNATIANQTTKLIPVKISRFNGIASGVSFELVYNKSVMQVLGFVASDAVPGSSIVANINNKGEASVALTNVLGISAYSINPTVLLFINTTAVGAVNDTTPLTARAVTASDAQFTPHDLIIENGQITIVVDVKGDFNHNGRVDIGDVAMVSYMVVNREPKLIPDADFNNNGDVDIGDAAKIAYYFVGLVREL